MPVFAASVNKQECPLTGELKAKKAFQIELLCAKKIPLESIGKVLEVCDIV